MTVRPSAVLQPAAVLKTAVGRVAALVSAPAVHLVPAVFGLTGAPSVHLAVRLAVGSRAMMIQAERARCAMPEPTAACVRMSAVLRAAVPRTVTSMATLVSVLSVLSHTMVARTMTWRWRRRGVAQHATAWAPPLDTVNAAPARLSTYGTQGLAVDQP